MGAQKISIFADKFSQNGEFVTTNFVSLEETFPTRRKFSDRLKFSGRLPPAPCRDATDCVLKICVIFSGWSLYRGP